MRRERERVGDARRALRPLAHTRAAALLLIGAVIVHAGCSRAPFGPTYSQDELKVDCERHHGVWHADELMGGFCEYRTVSTSMYATEV
jgi:hypothetical protein